MTKNARGPGELGRKATISKMEIVQCEGEESDVTVAKDYVSEPHIKELNRIVSAEYRSDFDRVLEETKRLAADHEPATSAPRRRTKKS